MPPGLHACPSSGPTSQVIAVITAQARTTGLTGGRCTAALGNPHLCDGHVLGSDRHSNR